MTLQRTPALDVARAVGKLDYDLDYCCRVDALSSIMSHLYGCQRTRVEQSSVAFIEVRSRAKLYLVEALVDVTRKSTDFHVFEKTRLPSEKKRETASHQDSPPALTLFAVSTTAVILPTLHLSPDRYIRREQHDDRHVCDHRGRDPFGGGAPGRIQRGDHLLDAGFQG